MGEIWEGYGRDKNNLHYAESPLAKGIPEDDGRDGDYFRPKSAGTSPHFDVSHLTFRRFPFDDGIAESVGA